MTRLRRKSPYVHVPCHPLCLLRVLRRTCWIWRSKTTTKKTTVRNRATPQVCFSNKEVQPITTMYFQWTVSKIGKHLATVPFLLSPLEIIAKDNHDKWSIASKTFQQPENPHCPCNTAMETMEGFTTMHQVVIYLNSMSYLSGTISIMCQPSGLLTYKIEFPKICMLHGYRTLGQQLATKVSELVGCLWPIGSSTVLQIERSKVPVPLAADLFLFWVHSDLPQKLRC